MYILEGNIGAGKSTFLKLVAQHLPYITVVQEPVYNWQKQVYGQSLLSNFYQDPKRWAYTMETFAMTCRTKEHLNEQANANSMRIIERSIYSGHYCFATNGHEHGFLSDLEWKLYLQWFDLLIPNKCKPPHAFIYLKVDPSIAYERIKKRNRLSEKNISLAYLKQIDRKHEQFLIEKRDILLELNRVPVLTLNCDQEFEKDAAQLAQHLQLLEDFMTQTELNAIKQKEDKSTEVVIT